MRAIWIGSETGIATNIFSTKKQACLQRLVNTSGYCNASTFVKVPQLPYFQLINKATENGSNDTASDIGTANTNDHAVGGKFVVTFFW